MTNRDLSRISTMWKSGTEGRIKPVIARDTTCSVSLLTGTICGSNFAIPSTKIPAHGNGKEFEQYAQSASPAVRRPARGDSAPSASKRLRRRGFQIRWPGARNLKRNQVTSSGTPEAESRKPEENKRGGRSPTPPPGRANRKVQQAIMCNLPVQQTRRISFLWRAAVPRSPQWKV